MMTDGFMLPAAAVVSLPDPAQGQVELQTPHKAWTEAESTLTAR